MQKQELVGDIGSPHENSAEDDDPTQALALTLSILSKVQYSWTPVPLPQLHLPNLQATDFWCSSAYPLSSGEIFQHPCLSSCNVTNAYGMVDLLQTTQYCYFMLMPTLFWTTRLQKQH
jgi:hypothetical protein